MKCIHLRTLMGNFDTPPEFWCELGYDCDETCPLLHQQEDEEEE